MTNGYMKSVLRQFDYYKMLGEKTFGQLTDEQLSWCSGDDTNSVFRIVNHLWEDMLTYWPEDMSSSRSPYTPSVISETTAGERSKDNLLATWSEGWEIVYSVLNRLTDSDLQKMVSIQGQTQTVLEAIHGQLTHYAYHVGQIVCLGKTLAGTTWQSFSGLRKQAQNQGLIR